jgi:hypothetical protein
LSLPGGAGAGIDLGVSIGDGGVKGFYLAMGDFYRVPARNVGVIAGRGIPDDELPVVFFLAARVGVAPGVIVDLRLGGTTWMHICLKYGFGADIFYMPVKAGPPYGKAYGHYMGKPKSAWKKLKLRDADIVNLVNLKFISGHYGYSAGEVIKMREQGKSFVAIHDNVKKARGGGKGSGKGGGKGGKGKNK